MPRSSSPVHQVRFLAALPLIVHTLSDVAGVERAAWLSFAEEQQRAIMEALLIEQRRGYRRRARCAEMRSVVGAPAVVWA